MGAKTRKKSSMADSDFRTSNGFIVGIGSAVVAAMGGMCALGGYNVVSAMNRQSDETIAAAREYAAKKRAGLDPSASQQQGSVQGITEQEENAAGWTSEQIKWMQDNHITYDKYGLPVDEDGNLVDDPTTQDDETKRYVTDDGVVMDENGNVVNPNVKENPAASAPSQSNPVQNPTVQTVPEGTGANNSNNAASQSVVTPVTADAQGQRNWWQDENGNLLPGLELDENGEPVHIVTSVDCLIHLGERYGYDYMELAEYNHVKNPDLIYDGDAIRFPPKN